MKNNKSKIIAVVAILLIVIIAVIVKTNGTDVIENEKNIETALITSIPTSAPVVEADKVEDNSIDEFISNIDVVPEKGEEQGEKIIPLSTKEVVFKEPVIEKTEPTVIPTEEPKKEDVEPTEIPVKEVKPTKTPEKEVKVTPVPTKKPEKEVVKTTPTPTKAPEKVETKTSEIKIAGINFPVLDKFNTSTLSNGRWGNGDESEKAINAFNKYINTVMESEDVGIFASSDEKLIMTLLDSSAPNLELTKWEDEKYYKITLHASLEQTVYDDDDTIAKLNRDSLLMFCSLVSSSPQKLYSIIYDSFETDETHGLSTETYKTFGDFQIKYSIASNKKSVSYTVKAK